MKKTGPIVVILLVVILGALFLLNVRKDKQACGNGICEKGETNTCPADCQIADNNPAGFYASVAEGFDWGLPASVKPTENSGVWILDEENPDIPQIKIASKRLYWSKLNPAEGVYDFSSVRDAIQIAKEKDLKLVFL